MPIRTRSAKPSGKIRRTAPRTEARLDKLIEEATVDCYNDSEEITGIFTMMEEPGVALQNGGSRSGGYGGTNRHERS